MRTKLLSELSTNISSGLTPLRSNAEFWENGTIPWLKTEQLGEKYIYETNEHISEAVLEKTSIKLFPENSLSIAMYGEGKTRGNLSILKKAMATNQACCNVAIDPDKADFEYVYYFLKTQYDELRNLSSGVRKNLNSNDIKNYPIRLPENLDSQKKIANVLKALDKKIELNNRINTELEAMAKTLYDYWFVQFDFPDPHGKPYKTSGGKMVYNETLKREIPEGWEVFPLSKHVFCNKKKLGKNHDYKWLNYLDTANLTNNIVGTIQKLDVAVDVIPSRANMLVNNNDILYSTVRPNQLHYGIIKDPIDNMVASTGFSVLSHKNNSDLNVFFYLHLTSTHNTNRLIKISESSKSSYPSISPDDILNIAVAIPSSGEMLAQFCGLLNPIFEKISENQKENNELETLRDWLLPMLMNGQVTVK